MSEYETGKWVGIIIGSLRSGVREMASTWPVSAEEKDADEVKQWCEIVGLECTFAEGSLSIVPKNKVAA